MIASVRAGIVAALVVLLSLSLTVAASAQKAFLRDDLADAAIKLEAQIRSEAGAVTKPVALFFGISMVSYSRSCAG